MQRYSYAGGNPTNLVDPFGLCGWSISPSNIGDCAKKGVGELATGAKRVIENPYVQQCLSWGVTGAIAGGVSGAAGGCAAGALSEYVTRNWVSDPVSQCLIWGGGALIGSRFSQYGSVAATGGCVAGAASWVAGHFEGSHNAGGQCAIWGLAAISYAVPNQNGELPSNLRRLASAAAACVSGAYG